MEDACYQAAIRLLQYRWRSEHEIAQRLQQRGFDPEEVRLVLDRLRQEHWLDDRRFAGEYARTRRLRRVGRFRIERELQSLGVPSEDVAAAAGDQATERANLIEVCQKRIRVLGRLRGPGFVKGSEGRRKLTAYLLRQGYDYAAIREVLEEELGK
jgi:regulatory protein